MAPPTPPPPPPPPPLPPLQTRKPSAEGSGQSLGETLARFTAADAANRAEKLASLEAGRSALPSLCGDTGDFLRMMEETQFEKYWQAIEPFTFRSSMSALTQSEVRALYEGYERALSGHRWSSSSEHLANDDDALASVARKVELAYGQLGISVGEPAFVRLSTRSPKDCVLTCPSIDFAAAMRAEMVGVKQEEDELYRDHPELPPSSELNRRLHALYIASTVLLATTTGSAAVERMLYSARIQEDLHVAADRLAAASSAPFEFNIVVREFARFRVRNEVRGFVYRRKFTALTQYTPIIFSV
jgi:hypothetical protein